VSDDKPPRCVACDELVDWDTMRWLWFGYEAEPTTAVCGQCLDRAADEYLPDDGDRRVDASRSLFWEVRCMEPRPGGFGVAVVLGFNAREAIEFALCRCRGPEDAAHVLSCELLVIPLGRAFQRAYCGANSDGGIVCVEYAEASK
jgi:hypothetical protein